MKIKIKFLIIISILTVAGLFILACNDSIPSGSFDGSEGTTDSISGGTVRVRNNFLITQPFEIVFDPGPDESIEWSSEIPGLETVDVDVPRSGVYGVYIIVGNVRQGFTATVERGFTQTFIFNP